MRSVPARKLLAAWMAEHGVSQSKLATQLGIGQPSVSLWLRGVARPGAHLRSALRSVAGVPEESWLTEREQRSLARIEAASPAGATEAP